MLTVHRLLLFIIVDEVAGETPFAPVAPTHPPPALFLANYLDFFTTVEGEVSFLCEKYHFAHKVVDRACNLARTFTRFDAVDDSLLQLVSFG